MAFGIPRYSSRLEIWSDANVAGASNAHWFLRGINETA